MIGWIVSSVEGLENTLESSIGANFATSKLLRKPLIVKINDVNCHSSHDTTVRFESYLCKENYHVTFSYLYSLRTFKDKISRFEAISRAD